jgi:hypothetical protein
MLYYLDLICKVGRWLATARSLANQTEELINILDSSTGVEAVLVDGLEF